MSKQTLAVVTNITPLIRTIRGQKVILDSDLARIYGVPTKRLNEQVKRNAKRFPADFLFQLTAEEAESAVRSRSQFATLNSKHPSTSSAGRQLRRYHSRSRFTVAIDGHARNQDEAGAPPLPRRGWQAGGERPSPEVCRGREAQAVGKARGGF